MARKRGQFAGVTAIVRYNRPMYAIAVVVGIVLGSAVFVVTGWWLVLAIAGLVLLLWNVLASLVVSWYVYDYTGYYDLVWLPALPTVKGSVWANIHAGLDETSITLLQRFPNISLHVFDFYDEKKHTEPSIRRARASAVPFPGTRSIDTATVAFAANTYDVILVLLSAHEIRNDEERVQFFKALAHSLKPGGSVIVAEHLRDWRNYVAYSLGALHFLSRGVWLSTFKNAGISVVHQHFINPFITVFYCTNGNTH